MWQEEIDPEQEETEENSSQVLEVEELVHTHIWTNSALGDPLHDLLATLLPQSRIELADVDAGTIRFALARPISCSIFGSRKGRARRLARACHTLDHTSLDKQGSRHLGPDP